MTLLDRLKLASSSPLLPLALLLISILTVFLFVGARGHFYRGFFHDLVSAEHLTAGVNFSPEHRFLPFHHKTLNEDGGLTYAPYNRWPIGDHAIIKVATLPFSGSLSAQITAARFLMLLLFTATVILAYRVLCRITSNRWIALAATLLAFASYYCLYYSDMIANEMGIDLFAVMLTLHGIVIFVQDGRFRQLVIKACLSLLLGWNVLALLLSFIIFSMIGELIRARSAAPAIPLGHRLLRTAGSLIRSRYVLLGVVALIFAAFTLTINVANEYFALGGEKPLTQLQSLGAIRRNIGTDQSLGSGIAQRFAWNPFLKGQFYLIGGMVVPYYFDALGNTPIVSPRLRPIIGVMAIGACLIGLAFFRHRILFATMATFGFLWPWAVRSDAFWHDYRGIHYVGIPLVLFSLALLLAYRLSGSNRLIVGLAVAAVLIFAGSSYQITRTSYDALAGSFNDADKREFHEAMMADFEVIRSITQGGVVFVPLEAGPRPLSNALTGVPYGSAYYLSGNTILYGSDRDKIQFADFVVTVGRQDGGDTLTPENRFVFLYDRADYDGSHIDKSAYNMAAYAKRISHLSDPVIESTYDVYHVGNELVYASAGNCENTDASFFLHIIPVDEKHLLYRNRFHGFENRDFHFRDFGWQSGDDCFAVRRLPEYDIAKIVTGQFDRNGRIWQGSFDIAVNE